MNSAQVGRKSGVSLLALGVIGLLGCPVWRTEHKVETTHKIDAHVVVDIREIREEADQIESQVRGTDGVAEGEPSAMVGGIEMPFQVATTERSLWSLFDISTPAYAQAEGGKDAAVQRRAARSGEISAALSAGCLGESDLGYVEVRPCDGDQSRYQALAKSENDDRLIIYRAIAVERGLDASQASVIGEIFAADIREKLKSGQLFQVPRSETAYQEFRESSLGQRLPDAQKGEWVRVP